MKANIAIGLVVCNFIAFAASCGDDKREPRTDKGPKGRAGGLGLPGEGIADSEVESSPCDGTVVDKSGGKNPDGSKIQRVVGRLNDPLVNLVYKTEGKCPVAMDKIVDKLKLHDSCQSPSNQSDGMETQVVTETGQQVHQASIRYRSVSTRPCNGRKPFELLFSQFGFGSPNHPIDKDTVPGGVEIMAFDKVAGVFNYYKEINGQLGFFGNSIDFITKGPGGPNVTSTRGCANCHTGGGVIMKELAEPWVHWETVTFATKGAKLLVKTRDRFLGARQGGINMERRITRPGNHRWNQSRVTFMREHGAVADLLRPLFCPVEVNTASMCSGSVSETNPKPCTFLPAGAFGPIGIGDLGGVLPPPPTFFADFRLPLPPPPPLPAGDYENLIPAIEQKVAVTGLPDLIAKFATIERSGADEDYVGQLIEAKVLDAEFVTDVLMIDFTRPTLSDDRCDLLAFAPSRAELDGPLNAKNLRAGFIAKLKGAKSGTPEGQLRAHFKATQDPNIPSVDHKAALATFSEACSKRTADLMDVVIDKTTGQTAQVSTYSADVMKLRSLRRKIVFGEKFPSAFLGSATHKFPVFETNEMLPQDNVIPDEEADRKELLRVHPRARLNPNDCSLDDHFVVPEIE